MAVIAVAAYNNLSVSAALPAIGDDLGNLAWLPTVVTVELIASAIAVLAVGPIIDSIGANRVMRFLLVAFMGAALVAGLAPTMAVLIVGRALQGLASGALIATVMAAMGLAVPVHLRARAYAANSSVWGVMGLAGPAVAALLLTIFDWRALFFVNIPVAVFAWFVGRNAFPGPTEHARAAKSDRVGITLAALFTVILLGAISALTWFTPLLLVLGGLVLWTYLRYERTANDPVLQRRHLFAEKFRWLHITAFLVISGGIAANAFLPVYIKAGQGASTGQAAFTVVFMTVGWTIGAFVSSLMAERRAGEWVIQVFSLMLAIVLAASAVVVGLDLPLPLLFALFMLVGGGLGGVSSVGLAVLQDQAEPAQMGRVNSAHQFIRTLGFSYGAAIGGAVIFGVVAARLGSAEVVRDLLGDDEVVAAVETVEAVQSGFFWALVVAATICSAAAVSSLKLSSAERTSVAERG
ncbi:MAG: MFS transporter [Acidimicrobiales bacterium]|nr:MFS transporter [Acidimicrobiales bacterium]